jgi:CheY-like chemotaxis protein
MCSILIVDDEEDIRDAMQMILERAGHQVRIASNGAEAIECQRREPADVIIADIIMPEKDGVSTIKEIRQQYPGTRIIAISGGGGVDLSDYKPDSISTTAYLAAAKQAGADLALTKPFERKDLIKAVDDLLNVH